MLSVCFFLLPSLSTSLQVSDAILDACLEQDPDAKVRKERKRESGKRMREIEEESRKKKQTSRNQIFFPSSFFFFRDLQRSSSFLSLSKKKINALNQVACETATKTNMIMVFGEITTKAKVDYEAIVRKTAREIGFTSDDVGLDADKCKVLVHLEEQSPDIGQGVHGLGTKSLEEIGAGDQGHMFG